MKKQVSTLSLIALAAFSIWQYFTEHKKDTKPRPNNSHNNKAKVRSKYQDFGSMMSSCAMMPLDKIKRPVDYYMLALSWSPAFCEKQRAKYGNNYLIQRNINVVQKSI